MFVSIFVRNLALNKFKLCPRFKKKGKILSEHSKQIFIVKCLLQSKYLENVLYIWKTCWFHEHVLQHSCQLWNELKVTWLMKIRQLFVEYQLQPKENQMFCGRSWCLLCFKQIKTSEREQCWWMLLAIRPPWLPHMNNIHCHWVTLQANRRASHQPHG